MSDFLKIEIDNQSFLLHPTGAMLHVLSNKLLIADLHIGKVNHFRKAGMAVPVNAKYANFDRLDWAIEDLQPTRLCFLGDLFHSYKNEEWNVFEDWLQAVNMDCQLIIGNHDIHDLKNLPENRMVAVAEQTLGNILMTHEPVDRDGFFNMCGHIHPGIILAGTGKQREKVSCFAQFHNRLILPAFGTFTGTFKLDINTCKHVYVCLEKEVLQLK